LASPVHIDLPTYQLLTNAAVTGAGVPDIVAGEYVWSLAGTVGGATIKLQALGPDNATYARRRRRQHDGGGHDGGADRQERHRQGGGHRRLARRPLLEPGLAP
jgi:hypothetical protein